MTILIKSVDDLLKCESFGFEEKGQSMTIYAVHDGQKKQMLVCLGSKPENLGLVIVNSPDEVRVSLAGSTWEKEKLALRLQRDSDKKVLTYLDAICRGLYEAARGDIDSKDWFTALDNFGLLKVKLHPTQTLYTADVQPADWRHIGTGEKHTMKRSASVEPIDSKEKNKKRKTTDLEGTMSTSALLSIVKANTVDTQKLLAAVESPKHHHYKLYKGDEICTTLEVGNIWTMSINGKDCCGVTLKARHMVVLSRAAEQAKVNDTPSCEDEDDPDIKMFE